MKKAEKITIKVLKVVERIARNEVEKTVLAITIITTATLHKIFHYSDLVSPFLRSFRLVINR